LKNINCIFITHSPFILTDIPGVNVLSLEVDGNNLEKKSLPKTPGFKIESFGTNIHDLLINGFFMKSTIGEFAKEKINSLAKELSDIILERKIDKPDNKKIYRMVQALKLEDPKGIIDIIGDDVVKEKLRQMYFIATEGELNNLN
jgi:hypothetical protein